MPVAAAPSPRIASSTDLTAPSPVAPVPPPPAAILPAVALAAGPTTMPSAAPPLPDVEVAPRVTPMTPAQSYAAIVARASQAVERGRYDEAIAFTSQATQLDAHRHEAYVIAGVALFETGSGSASILALQTALNHAPEEKRSAIQKMLETVNQSAMRNEK